MICHHTFPRSDRVSPRGGDEARGHIPTSHCVWMIYQGRMHSAASAGRGTEAGLLTLVDIMRHFILSSSQLLKPRGAERHELSFPRTRFCQSSVQGKVGWVFTAPPATVLHHLWTSFAIVQLCLVCPSRNLAQSRTLVYLQAGAKALSLGCRWQLAIGY